MSHILTKSYVKDINFHQENYTRLNMVVVDPESQFLGFYRHCQDHDHGVPRCHHIDWSMIAVIDFKLSCCESTLGPRDPTDFQLHCLDLFLANDQSHKLLHVALSHDSSSEFLNTAVTHSGAVLALDLHDYHTNTAPARRLELHRRLCLDHYAYADYHYLDQIYVNLLDPPINN